MATTRLGRLTAHLDPTTSPSGLAPPPSPVAASGGAALPAPPNPGVRASAGGGAGAVFRQEVVDTFDESKWLADGYYAWPGIMTDSCRQRFSESLRYLQDTQDYIIHNTKWGAGCFPTIFRLFFDSFATDLGLL